MKIRNFATLSSVIVLSATAQAASISLENSSLETNSLTLVNSSIGWVQPATGWFTYNTGTAQIGVSTSTGFWNLPSTDGTSSGYVTSTSTTDGGSVYQNVVLDPGSYRLTISVASSTSAPKQNGLFSLSVFDSGPSRNALTEVQQSPIQTVVFGTAFTDYTLDFDVTSTSNYAVGFRNRGFESGSQPGNPEESTIFFDNIRLESVPEPSSAIMVGLAAALLGFRRRG